MASYSATASVHKTLTATTVDTVTLTLDDVQVVEIINRGTTDPLFVTVGLTNAVPAAPTVLGNDTLAVPAGAVRTVRMGGSSPGTDFLVKLIAASAVAYSVQAGGQ